MTERERNLAVLLFGTPDKIPLTPGGGRKSTRETWHTQGLPEDIEPGAIQEYAYRQAGGTDEWPKGGLGFPINHRMMPEFEEKVIEVKEDSQVVQDWKGNICEIGKEFTVEYLRNAIDFVTRRWIKCPVENRQDWEDMKKRYVVSDPARYPDNPEELGKELESRDHFVQIGFYGPYWQLREWCGFEGLSMMFYDDPDLVKDMAEFCKDYVLEMMDRIFQYFTPDSIHISEDMAYKGYSMLSPQMTKEFLFPVWKAWGEKIRSAGVPLYAVDSDGYIGELIPLWIEAGMNACDPIEVAAGNDIVDFREKFGKNMAYRGGIDKRAMAKGGKVLEDEIKRVTPVIEDGGYIPGCDHGVPSDVSWPNFVHYTKLLAEVTGWTIE